MSTLTLQPNAANGIDTMISSLQTSTNYGTTDLLQVGNARVGSDDFRRSLYKFDISSIPAGSVISSATLTLTGDYSTTGGVPSSGTFYCYRCTRNWVKGEATWTIYSTGNNWATSGGGAGTDYVTTDGDSSVQQYTDTSLEFDGLAALAQDALDNRSGILNLIVIGPETAGVRFYSETSASDDADDWPQLEVVYFYSTHYHCASSVQAAIQALDLTGIADADILLQKVPLDRTDDAPSCTVSTWMAETMVSTQGTNVRDDVGYPVTVKFRAGNGGDLTSNHARMLEWRQTVAKYFRNQRLSGVDEIYTCRVEPAPVFAPGPFLSKAIDESAFVLRFMSREARG